MHYGRRRRVNPRLNDCLPAPVEPVEVFSVVVAIRRVGWRAAAGAATSLSRESRDRDGRRAESRYWKGFTWRISVVLLLCGVRGLNKAVARR